MQKIKEERKQLSMHYKRLFTSTAKKSACNNAAERLFREQLANLVWDLPTKGVRFDEFRNLSKEKYSIADVEESELFPHSDLIKVFARDDVQYVSLNPNF